jgi:hypothetical protein
VAVAPALTERLSNEAPSHSQAGGGCGRRRRRRERLCRRLLVPSADPPPPPPPSAAILPPWSCRGPPCSPSCPEPRRSRPRAEGAVAASRPARAEELRARPRAVPEGPHAWQRGRSSARSSGRAGGAGPGPPSLPRPGPAARAGAVARGGRRCSLRASRPHSNVLSTEGSRVLRGGGEPGAGH